MVLVQPSCALLSPHTWTCSGRFDSSDKRQDDRAKAVYSNADTYFGQYSDDRRQGVGLYLVAKGGGYAGSYVGSKREGQGIMRMPDGALYHGQFAEDKFEGQGQYEYVDGSTYVGAWKGGKKHGEVNTHFYLLYGWPLIGCQLHHLRRNAITCITFIWDL